MAVNSKTAAAIAHDGAKTFSLALAVRKSDGSTIAVDDTGPMVVPVIERTEALTTLQRSGFGSAAATQYASLHKTHSKADALTAAGSL